MRITVTTQLGKRSFAGTLVGGAPRVVEVSGMELDALLPPAMLYVNNLDKPGFIGALGVLLGDAGVNIATFNLGRRDAGEDAIAIVGVDSAPDEALLARVKALPQCEGSPRAQVLTSGLLASAGALPRGGLRSSTNG